MEGGNLARNSSDNLHDGVDDLCVLSTHRDPSTQHFNGFNMTSAASAQAAWLAAQIQSTYPNIWPETIRALIVHSARWTEILNNNFYQILIIHQNLIIQSYFEFVAMAFLIWKELFIVVLII